MDFIFNNDPEYLRRHLEAHKFFNALLLFVLMVCLFVIWDLSSATSDLRATVTEEQQTTNFWQAQHRDQKRVADRLLRNCSGGSK